MIRINPKEVIPEGYYWLRYANKTRPPEVLHVCDKDQVYQFVGHPTTAAPS